MNHGLYADPLLATGRGSSSDLLTCDFDGRGRLRFGLDHYGSDGPRGEWMPYDPLVLHTAVIWMGSLGGPAATSPEGSAVPWPDRLVIVFDGKTALNVEQVFYDSDPESIAIGGNPWGSSTAGPVFTGSVAGVRQVGFEGLPALNPTGRYGTIEMKLQFPTYPPAGREPLVVTGAMGAGDFIYASYPDRGHVEFGFDHWGIGGITGTPVEIDHGRPHTVSVTMDSLLAPGTGSGLVRVTIDGKVALEGHSPCHPSAPRQIRVGENPIGGSTCGPAFSGRVFSVTRSGGASP